MLADDKIRLRALEPTDLDVLFAWENDASLWAVGSTIAPFSRKQLWNYIENYDNDIFSARQLRFMVEDVESGEAVGMVDLFDFDPVSRRASVGILIDAKFGNKGYGTRALQLLCDYASQAVAMYQLVAFVPVKNEYSRRLFARCKFDETALLKDWIRVGVTYHDVAVYQRVLG
ncbi:MAG: GNAT family N-acetyltransferase [Muribaculaceae bacterium]|nr:GNAT family N-acetyltransferase [Muribaculaceae bacterium]